MQAHTLLADLEAVVALGFATLHPDVFSDHVIGDVAAAAHEVATTPQVATPERRPQPSIVAQEMMRTLPLDRLHDTARREVGWDADQQMDMVGPYVPFENLDVLAAADLPDQIPQAVPHLPAKHRLAILRGEHEMVVQTIDSVGRSTQFAHGRPSYRSLLKASPEGEGFHPSQRGDSKAGHLVRLKPDTTYDDTVRS